MNIKRIIDKNGKLIWYVVIIIVFALFAIKSLNSYYEEDERKKEVELNETIANAKEEEDLTKTENNYNIENNTIENTMKLFVNYCNKKEIENAYDMLTEECKNAMFPTIADFKNVYINNVYNVTREYELLEWSVNDNISTYQITLFGDMLSTGMANNSTQEYYTFVKEDKGNFKLNVNNYIYGEYKNIEKTINNITIKIGHVDVYSEYEEIKIIITNNSSKTISLTGNKYKKNIYLQNSKDTTFSSLNSRFDSEEIVMQPNNVQTFIVRFNKNYSISNTAEYLVLSDVILDYEDYLESEDKSNYWNRTSIKISY